MPRFVRVFAIILTTATNACNISVDLSDTAELVSGNVSGILNGINNSQPDSTLVRQIGLSMWRGPRNRFYRMSEVVAMDTLK